MGARLAHRPVTARIDQFAGLADDTIPVKNSRIDSPDLLNVELANDILEKRNGFRRLHTNRLRNASVRLDGLKDYYRIPNIVPYQLGGANVPYVCIGVFMRAMPTSTKALFTMGFGGGANQSWSVYFDPALGAGVGGFGTSLYDVGAAGNQVTSVADASAVGMWRIIEGYLDLGTGQWTIAVWKEDGTVTRSGSGTVVTGPGLASTEDLFIGAAESAANTVDTTSFPNATIAEARYFVGTAANTALCRITTTNKWYQREIEDSNISLFTGYWRCNDGNTSGVLADLVSGNSAVPPEEAVAWSNDTTKIIGTSGLQFHRGAAFIHLQDMTPGASATTSTFIPTAGNFGNFTVRLIFTPVLPPGATAMPDMCIMWAGHNAVTPNRPQPVGLSIVNDEFIFSFDDNGTLRTAKPASASAKASALNGKKLRIELSRSGAGGGTNQISITVGYLTTAGSVTALVAFTSVPTACTGTAAGAVSQNWAFMQHISAFLQGAGTGGVGGTFGTIYTTNIQIRTASTGGAETAHPHGGGFGYLDSVQLIHCNSPLNAQNVLLGSTTSIGPTAIYQQIINWQSYFPFCTTIFNMDMDEGAGNVLKVDASTPTDFQAVLHPQLGRSVKWDVGMVDPYLDPPGQTLAEYHGFKTDGTRFRQTLCFSGSTIYRIDEDTGIAVPIGAGLFQGGQWTKARLGSDLYAACTNGKRPVRWNGTTLTPLGIEAPLSPCQVITKAAGGTFVPGSVYTFYITFRNKGTGDESNPSPPVTVTFAALNNTIDAINLPISADAQVSQRRIWMVPPPGTQGAPAYLLATVDDNVTTQLTTDITTPVFVGQPLEYRNNREAPQASVIEIYKDFAFVGGNQIKPTRFYRSVAGLPSRWNWDEFFVDLDLDTGDPIVATKKQLNNLFVSLRDGWARVYPTGDSTVPVAFAFTRRDHGATGPSALAVVNDKIYYLSERDVYSSDGSSEENISDPPDDRYAHTRHRTSIANTMIEGLNDAIRESAVVVYHRSLKQIWIACASAGSAHNDQVLVYNTGRGFWSKYDIPAATLCEVDDGNDQTRILGVVAGHVCRMDEPDWQDGIQTAVVGIATGGTTTTATVTGTPFAGKDLRGLRAHIYDLSARTLRTGIVYSNTASTLTFYSSVGAPIMADDEIAIGGFIWYADFIVDFGDPTTKKVLNWITLIGESSYDGNTIVVTLKPNAIGRTWNPDGGVQAAGKWRMDDTFQSFSIGGEGRSFRLRIQDSTLPDNRPSQCPPNILGKISIASIIVEGVVLDVV